MAATARNAPPLPSREELIAQTRRDLEEGRRTFGELFLAANAELDPRRAAYVLRELTGRQ